MKLFHSYNERLNNLTSALHRVSMCPQYLNDTIFYCFDIASKVPLALISIY